MKGVATSTEAAHGLCKFGVNFEHTLETLESGGVM